jgi:lipopolysaccharide export system protein LptA
MVMGLLWASAAAAEAPSMPGHPEGPMAISSRSMTVKNLDHRIIFERDVVVKKGDMDLQADRVEVILSASPNEAAEHVLSALPGAGGAMLAEDNVERIEANGRVKVMQGGKTVTADQAVYHSANETIVLTGRPETWEDGYRIQGSRITILLKEQRSVVEESRVVIYPDEGSASGGP